MREHQIARCRPVVVAFKAPHGKDRRDVFLKVDLLTGDRPATWRAPKQRERHDCSASFGHSALSRGRMPHRKSLKACQF
jgi:hypothetical protein